MASPSAQATASGAHPHAGAPSATPGVPGMTLVGAVVAAVAWGSWSASGQVAKVVRTHFIKGEFAWVSRDVFWMSPLANVFYFLLVALLLWGLTRWRARGASAPLIGGVLAGLATFGVVIPFGGIHEYAVLALAAGVGVQYARLVRRGAPRLRRWIQVSGITAGLLLVGIGLAERLTREGRDSPSAVRPASVDAPNVIVIIWDTVRAANLNLFGYERATVPNLTRLAATSTTFDWAIAPAPWTLPSHCSMFTGLHPGEHSCRWDDPLLGTSPTVAEVFARNGYRTGAFVANPFYTTHETGLGRGFAVFSDFPVTVRQTLLSSSLAQTAIGRDVFRGEGIYGIIASLRRFAVREGVRPLNDFKRATMVTDDFLKWQATESGPFFAFLNYFDAHDPYEPPTEWRTKFSSKADPVARYDGGIAYMDAELARLTGELSRRGQLDRTILVVTSDHGELFGEHGLGEHGHALYLPLTHVPLVMRYPPALPAGQRVSRPVPLRNLARTLTELAGLPDTIAGINFATQEWRSEPPPDSAPQIERVALSETEKNKLTNRNGPARYGAVHALVDDRYHYIQNPKGLPELFAYKVDPHEKSNLATTAEGATLAAKYRALLPATTRRLVQ